MTIDYNIIVIYLMTIIHAVVYGCKCNYYHSHSPNIDSVVPIVTSLGETVELEIVGLVGPLKIDHI